MYTHHCASVPPSIIQASLQNTVSDPPDTNVASYPRLSAFTHQMVFDQDSRLFYSHP